MWLLLLQLYFIILVYGLDIKEDLIFFISRLVGLVVMTACSGRANRGSIPLRDFFYEGVNYKLKGDIY